MAVSAQLITEACHEEACALMEELEAAAHGKYAA